ncbi:MAG: hypothetical protein KJ556_21140 [Gammaproteobacteria bacterium]|nr:hypothetical protein [Gammaproteobacteria bacterium]
MEKGLEMKYFVLKPRSKDPDDPYAYASRQAMLRYSYIIRPFNALLADQLLVWVKKEAFGPTEKEADYAPDTE